MNIKIGDIMKDYERKAEEMVCLDKHKPWIARLDGHKFSTFCKVFRKPFDEIFSKIMVRTAESLIKTYGGTTAYTQSDEITLIFPAIPKDTEVKTELPFRGRIMKMSTLMAGYCSSRFNHFSREFLEDFPKDYEKYEKVRDRLTNGRAHFDCRVFNVNSNEEVVENLKWRITDAMRNSKTNLGRKYYSQKEMNGVKAYEVVEMLKKEKNVNWEDYPYAYRVGVFLKKELFQKMAIDQKTKKEVEVTRSRVMSKNLPIREVDEKTIDTIMRKYW